VGFAAAPWVGLPPSVAVCEVVVVVGIGKARVHL